jgi:AAA+ ATPase superfamily predicted ATPase
MSNPYLNRVMVKQREGFFGRTNEVRRIYSRLSAIPPGSVSIVGDRKIGKSSLLSHLHSRQSRNKNLEQPEKMVMVFLDLQQQKNMTLETFVKMLLSMVAHELRGRLEISDCDSNLEGVRDMVQRLDENGYRLAILLDEFEAVTTNQNFDLEFFSFLRYLANHYNVAYLTSSAHHLQLLCHTKEISDSPFFNIFSALRLSAFTRKEAEELIRVPSERINKPLVEYTDQILQLSGLFPFFIQIACGHCIEFLEENPERELDFTEIRQRFYEEAKLHYQYMWTVFDSHERSAIVRIAREKSIPDALTHVLGELSTRHYVETHESNPKLFSSTFEDFVKSSEEGKKKSLFGRLLRRG